MKKSTLITTLAFAFIMLLTTNVNAQKFNGIDKSVVDIAYYKTDRNSPPIVKVVYGRPLKKGRAVFGGLVPYGKVWRTGANEASEIKFYSDVKVGDKMVKAGTYSLFTIPGEKEWTIIINSDTDVWGAYSYNPSADVDRITVPATNDGESLEAFSITFTKGNMHLGWDTTRVSIPLSN